MFIRASNKQLFFIYRSNGLGVVLSRAEIGLTAVDVSGIERKALFCHAVVSNLNFREECRK